MGVPKFFRWLSERYPLINQMLEKGDYPPDIGKFFFAYFGKLLFLTWKRRQLVPGHERNYSSLYASNW
jgi:5'-3' exoribonuclease 1